MTEAVARIRYHASRLSDLPIPGLRDIAREMLRDLDALQLPATPLSGMTTEQLRSEIVSRLRSVNTQIEAWQKDLAREDCSQCGTREVRASGMCARCYHRDWLRRKKKAA